MNQWVLTAGYYYIYQQVKQGYGCNVYQFGTQLEALHDNKLWT